MRNEISQSLNFIKIGRKRFAYLNEFIKNNKKTLFLTLLFLFLQTTIEIILLVLASNSLKNISATKSHLWLAIIILIFCVIYTGVSFLAVRYERTFVLKLVNDLRKKLFSMNLEKDVADNNNETKASFVAKTSYHLSLLTMGIDNTLLSSIRWFLYILVLIVFSIFNNGLYFNLIGIVFIFSILLFYISYLVSKKYISRQVASYSKVIRHITDSMLEIPLIKNFHREWIVKKRLDKIVDVDTHFRIIRDTWIRYSSRVVFIIIVAIGAIYFLITSYYPVLSFGGLGQVFVKGIFYVYAIRILYASSKSGLYLLPLRLGIFLSVPERFSTVTSYRREWLFKTINFKSNKIKLFKEGEYYKDISLLFTQGGRYLFYGDYQVGKTHLAALLAGQGYFSCHSWITKVDNERFSYNSWSEIFHDNYFFSTNFSSDASVGEVIMGKEREDIGESDISLMNTLAEKYPIFTSVFSKTRFTGESIRLHTSSMVSLFTIQTAYCIVNKPKMIIIDNIWVDLGYAQIKELIQILEKELPESIIIIFSREKNLTVSYTSIYEIKKSSIESS